MNHVNGIDNSEKIVILDAGAQYGKVGQYSIIINALLFSCPSI